MIKPAQPERIERIRQIVKKIDSLDGIPAAQNFLSNSSAKSGPEILSFINAHGINMAAQDPRFFRSIMNSDYLFRDGVGLEILMNAMGVSPGWNLNGTDVIPFYITFDKERSRHSRAVTLFGTVEPYLSSAKRSLEKSGVRVVGSMDGFCESKAYVDYALKAPCDVIVLGMGMPKQELVAEELKKRVGYNCLIINGGAIIDFLGGRVSRAPAWVQRIRCEWIYRMAQEPKRLWRRYVLGGFVFMYYLIRLKCSRVS